MSLLPVRKPTETTQYPSNAPPRDARRHQHPQASVQEQIPDFAGKDRRQWGDKVTSRCRRRSQRFWGPD